MKPDKKPQIATHTHLNYTVDRYGNVTRMSSSIK